MESVRKVAFCAGSGSEFISVNEVKLSNVSGVTSAFEAANG